MSSERYTVDINLTNEGLNSMLPNVVGAIEELEEATLQEIKKHTENDINKKVSDTDLRRAIENGIKLGIVKMQREFKVCKEFTTREIRRLKYVEENFMSDTIPQTMLGKNHEKKSILDFVKYHRNQRKRKNTMKRKKQQDHIYNKCDAENELDDYMCRKCRKSLEKKRLERSRSRHYAQYEEFWDEEDSQSSEYSEPGSNVSYETKPVPNKKNENTVKSKKDAQEKTSNAKSRLLVEKNPLETEPPYYDIFT